jgi:hypothetical protein
MYGKKIKTSNAKTISIKLKTLNLISIFGTLILLYDLFTMNNINLGLRIVDQNISILGIIGNILASLGIISWLTSLYEFKRNGRSISLLSYLTIFAYVSGGMISAGRQSVIIISISSIILFIWSNKKNKELSKDYQSSIQRKFKIPWGILIVSIIFFSYFFFISAVRSQIFKISDKELMLENFFNAKISDETSNTVKMVEPFSDIYIELLFYYSHQLVRLDLLYENYNYHPLFGLSQLSYVERRVQWLFGKQGEKSWDEVVRSVEYNGRFSSHTWGTFITNFIIDFGRFGALIVCYLVGIISGIFYRKIRDPDTPLVIIRQVLICTGMVFSIQFSPFSELTWTFPLIVSSFIKVISK